MLGWRKILTEVMSDINDFKDLIIGKNDTISFIHIKFNLYSLYSA